MGKDEIGTELIYMNVIYRKGLENRFEKDWFVNGRIRKQWNETDCIWKERIGKD